MDSNNYTKHTYKNDTFYLGLTLAGAVSAGAYTGGVLDYLFEVLDKWEKAKAGTLEIKGYRTEDIPKHKVSIDVIGGTSAGGMTAIMTALYAIKGEINPVESPESNNKSKNLFYDTWVNLDDSTDRTTLLKALDNEDLKTDEQLISLLNSSFIDRIAKKAFEISGAPSTNPISNLPSYISSDLEMLISHTMLRGIPLVVDFSHGGSSLTNPPSHATYEHFLFSHFKLNEGRPVNPHHYIDLNPFKETSKNHLKKAALATGAFPVGLKYREFDHIDFNVEYLKNILCRIIEKDMGNFEPEIKSKIKWDAIKDILENYKSVTIDGGAINNEPYSEVTSILRHRYQSPILTVDNKPYQKYGMIMIDPFPDFFYQREEEKYPKGLFQVSKGTIGTLWEQSKIKRSEVVQQFNEQQLRGVIYPVKYKDNTSLPYPLACGSLGAFGGFLDINFRKHDFFLGRNNARNFVRAYLSVPYNKEKGIVHPLHSDKYWNDAMREKFMITFNDGTTYLPLIPDMNLLIKDIASNEEVSVYDIPEMPKMKIEDIKEMQDNVTQRASGILGTLLQLEKGNTIKKTFFGRIIKKIVLNIKKLILKKISTVGSNYVGRFVIETIEKDLKKFKLLDED